MKVVISGSHGLVGAPLAKAFKSIGHEVSALVRRAPRDSSEIQWTPYELLDPGKLEGAEALIHLAGENIAEGRWTDARKQRIRDSRVKATHLLSESLARMSKPPQVFVCASAIGYYGNRGPEILREDSAPGQDFLARVCVDWEKATGPASSQGIRTVNARFGVILSKDGGALKKMLTPFRLGAGGEVGNGKQWLSWIALDDVIGVLKYAVATTSLNGPVNVVAPNPVTNAEFTKALGQALARPTLFPMPEFAARLFFGEMADALLLSSQRVEPERLEHVNYDFKYPDLKTALAHLLAD